MFTRTLAAHVCPETREAADSSVQGRRQWRFMLHCCKREPHLAGTKSADRGHQWWGRKSSL